MCLVCLLSPLSNLLVVFSIEGQIEDGTKKSLKLKIIKHDKKTFIPIHHLG